MLIKASQDTEVPNRPLLKAGETVEVSDELGNILVHRGLAEAVSDSKGYETQDVAPRKKRSK